MESKKVFVFLIYCVIINAQLISSLRMSTKIRKVKLPACGCQNPVGVPCGCGNVLPNPTYNCGCGNPGMCGCQKYWDQMDIPSCSLEMPAPFAVDAPYNVAPETCACRSVVTLPFEYLPMETMALNPCGCQSVKKPCGCQMPAILPTNIYDFLSYMDIPCGCQNVVKVTNYDYIPCGCGIPQCGCQASRDATICGCQASRDATVCGCRAGTVMPNYLPAIEPVTTVFSGLGVPYPCGCDGRCYMLDVPCGCQTSACNCGCQRCGYGCGCMCGSGCECGGKYLRQVTLQPPFL